MLRIAFLGAADFSVPSLRVCAETCEVAAVVTQPDRLGSRGRPAPRPVAAMAAALGLPVQAPERLRDPAATEALLRLNLDALVVAAYGQIVPVALLEGPRCGGVNVHPSLLPRWRGAIPVAAAINAGDSSTGVSIMRMEAGLDTGPVYAVEEMPLPPDATTPVMTAELAERGARLLRTVLDRLEAGNATAAPQDDTRATYSPRLTRADGWVDWAVLDAPAVDRHVRAFQPWPGSTALVSGAEVRLLAGRVEPHLTAAPGSVVAADGEGIVVAARADGYRITELQPPGGRRMAAAAYWRGRRGTG